ncbi:MAG: FkbM family methyltransferase [Erythrobacter sp.]
MPQNNIISSIRRFAWRAIPAPILNLAFGDKLQGLGKLIEAAGVTKASAINVPEVATQCYQLDLENGTVIVSTPPLSNNVKITHKARQALKVGPEYSKGLVDLILRYSYPHALVPVIEIPVPDAHRGGFHLQHRNLPQETEDFTAAQRDFLKTNFTPQAGWNIVDIGCYLGHGATHLAQLVGASGRVLAVEAIPENSRIAAYQVKANGLDNAQVLNRAIWKTAGETVPMNVTENQANAIASDVITSADKIDIPTTSIAELTGMLGKAADLVSLTVNGAEVEALDSLDDMPDEMRPLRMVMPGWYPTDDSPRSDILSAKLTSLGYEILVTKHQFVIAWRSGI